MLNASKLLFPALFPSSTDQNCWPIKEGKIFTRECLAVSSGMQCGLPLTMHSSGGSCTGYRKFLNRNEWQTKSLLSLQQGKFLIMWMFHVCLRTMAMWFAVGELLLIHLVRKLKFGNLFFIFQQQTFTSIIEEIFFKSEENTRSLNEILP